MTNPWTTAGLDLHLAPAEGGQRAGLETELRTAVQTRRLAPGTRLPSTRGLAADLGIARGTVVAVYDQLVAEGYLISRRGIGTVVADLGPLAGTAAERPHPRSVRMDLRPGTPDVTSFPAAAWVRATRQEIAAAPAKAFGYGDVRGRPELRGALAEYLARTRGVHVTPGRIVITAGCTEALYLLCTALAGAGRATMAMEDPGFSMHRPVARGAGLRIVPLPVDERGARADALGAVDAVVVTAAHQYPTGVTLHPARRQALTAWARAADGLIVEDDYDGEFRYDRQPIGALQGMAPDHVAYVGTASKTLAPGIRLGWMVIPDRITEAVVEVKLRTDLAAPTITQLTLAEMITSHAYDRHIRTMRSRYRRRRDLLVGALEWLGPDLIAGVPAGLQAALRLPGGGPTEDEVVAAAAAEGLALEGVSAHWHGDGERWPGLLIGFSRPSERAYPAAIGLLERVLRRMIGRPA